MPMRFAILGGTIGESVIVLPQHGSCSVTEALGDQAAFTHRQRRRGGLETSAPSQCRPSHEISSTAVRRVQRRAGYPPSSSSRRCADSGAATPPCRISRRVALGPYMAWSPLWSAWTTAPSTLAPAKTPLLRE